MILCIFGVFVCLCDKNAENSRETGKYRRIKIETGEIRAGLKR